jgi:acyl-CoA synthetase (AMP-forming)/AMP-acid ligase II/acyl carrier protein
MRTSTDGLRAKAARVETAGGVSWLELLERHALDFAGKQAYVTLHGSGATGPALTYRELRTSVRCIASCLVESLPAQSRILILLPQDLSFIKSYLSCLIAGMVAVPVYLPTNPKHVKKVQGIVADCRPRAILWSESSTPKLRSDMHACGGCEDALWIDCDAAESARESAAPDVGPDHLAMLQYTSGSTGAPKGVMLTHRNLLANQQMIQDTFEHTSESIVVACLPFYHDMGLIGNILQPLYVGATCLFLSPRDVVRQPLAWLQAISTHRATTSGGPNAFYDLCIDRIDVSGSASGDAGDLDLSSWNVAFNGAEPIRAATIETFSRKFASYGFRKSAFLPVYGLAEASLLVTGKRKAPLPRIAGLDRAEYERAHVVDQREGVERPSVNVVSCGLPAPGVEIVIRGSDGRPRGDREIGEILVRSDSVAQGYWNSPSDDAFEVTPRLLRTGDLGFVAEGELFVTGRLKEIMIVRGRNYYPADIEATAAQASDATAGCHNAVFSIDVDGREEIVLVQEISRDKALDHEAVRRAITSQCWAEHEIQLHDIVLVRTGTIPRTTSGKTRRLFIKQLYSAGQVPALGTPEADAAATANANAGNAHVRAALEAGLIAKFRSAFPGLAGDIHPDTSLSAIGLDSYSLVRLSDEIGEQLGVELPLMEVVKRTTIADLANHVAANLASFKPRLAIASEGTGSKTRQSHGQMALWNREKATGHESVTLNVSRAVRVSRRLEPEVFQAAVAKLVDRYEILRTELREENGECVQVSVSERRPAIEYVDATDWDDARIAAYLEEKANTRFDLANGQLWRWYLLDRPTSSIILFTFHHTICDLETINMLIEALFRDAKTLKPAPSYADYVERQYAWLASDAGQRSRAFWSERLRDVDLKLNIVSKKNAQSRANAAPGFRALRLDRSATDALVKKSAAANAGLNVLLLAAFAVVLKRYTQQEKFAIGVPVSARTHRQFERTLGYMVNVLPIVVDFSVARHLGHVVQQVRESTLLALQHQQYPLPLIVQQYRRDHPEFVHDLDILNVELVYQKARLSDGQDTTAFALNEESGTPVIIGDLEVFPARVNARDVEFPVKMVAGVIDGSLTVHLQWDDSVMYESVMSAILDDCHDVLKNATSARDFADCGL